MTECNRQTNILQGSIKDGRLRSWCHFWLEARSESSQFDVDALDVRDICYTFLHKGHLVHTRYVPLQYIQLDGEHAFGDLEIALPPNAIA